MLFTLVFAIIMQISKVEATEFRHELTNEHSSTSSEIGTASQRNVTMQHLYINVEEPQMTFNTLPIPGCFNLTLNIAVIGDLSYEKRYHFIKARAQNLTADNLTTCFPVSNFLKKCNLSSVHQMRKQRFSFNENLDLEDKMGGKIFGLGNYIISTWNHSTSVNLGQLDQYWDSSEVMICEDNFKQEMMPFCQEIELSPDQYEVHSYGIYLQWLEEMLWFPSYKVNAGKNNSINLCYPLKKAFRECSSFDSVEMKTVKQQADDTIGKIFIPSKIMIVSLGNYYATPDFHNVTVCPNKDAIFNKDKMRRIYTIIFAVSALSLLVTFLIHLAVPTINNNPKPFLSHIFSLMAFYFAMIVRNFNRHVETAAIRYVMFSFCHYFSLATFFWLSVLSFDLWRNFSDLNDRIGRRSCFSCKLCKANRRSTYFFYCIYAWGFPVIIVTSALLLEFHQETQTRLHLNVDLYTRMWFTEQHTGLLFFYGPVAAILLENLFFFMLTILNLREVSRGTRSVNKDLGRQMFIVCIKLFVVMGFSWIIEVAGFVGQPDPKVIFVPDLINCFSGFIIFVLFICKRSTLRAIRRRMQKNRKSSHLTLTVSTSINT